MNVNPELSVSQFVAVFNQTLEFAYPQVVVFGELANFRVNKNRWVYFDLKDELAKVSFFGSVYNLPGPLEDGMMLKVRGIPRLHPQYGFSISFSNISALGSGSIKRLNDLLMAKLTAEGLFAPERKRNLPYLPSRIGLITSIQSAAYADFIKILSDRWAGLTIECYDVNVQGEQAPADIINGLEFFSSQAEPPDVIVMVRGGGSPEDLAAFNSEQVTRAVAASRVPTLVAIGHERDISLSELAADKRASTPSNAAEILVPDKREVSKRLSTLPVELRSYVDRRLRYADERLIEIKSFIPRLAKARIETDLNRLGQYRRLLEALNPKDILRRGFAIVRIGSIITDGSGLKQNDIVTIEMAKIEFEAGITRVIRSSDG